MLRSDIPKVARHYEHVGHVGPMCYPQLYAANSANDEGYGWDCSSTLTTY